MADDFFSGLASGISSGARIGDMLYQRRLQQQDRLRDDTSDAGAMGILRGAVRDGYGVPPPVPQGYNPQQQQPVQPPMPEQASQPMQGPQAMSGMGPPPIASQFGPMQPPMPPRRPAYFGGQMQASTPPMAAYGGGGAPQVTDGANVYMQPRPGAPTPAGMNFNGQLGPQGTPNRMGGAGNVMPTGPGGATPRGDGPLGQQLGQQGGFASVMPSVFHFEGGYNPRDPVTGMGVNFGIDQRAHPNIDVSKLTKDQAAQIYKEEYWNKINGDRLPQNMQLPAMDVAVRSGPGVANQLMAQSGGDPQKFMQAYQQWRAPMEQRLMAQGKGGVVANWHTRDQAIMHGGLKDGGVSYDGKTPTSYSELPNSLRIAVQNVDKAMPNGTDADRFRALGKAYGLMNKQDQMSVKNEMDALKVQNDQGKMAEKYFRDGLTEKRDEVNAMDKDRRYDQAERKINDHESEFERRQGRLDAQFEEAKKSRADAKDMKSLERYHKRLQEIAEQQKLLESERAARRREATNAASAGLDADQVAKLNKAADDAEGTYKDASEKLAAEMRDVEDQQRRTGRNEDAAPPQRSAAPPSSSKEVGSQAEYDALPKGATFTWQGKTYTKQ